MHDFDNHDVNHHVDNNDNQKVFSRGFPVGFHLGTGRKAAQHYLYNHLRIKLLTHDDVGGIGGKL